MVDIHCHILPEVDDGARSWDMAAEMCRMAAADGIRHIVATPHANSAFAYDRVQHEATLARLRQLAGDHLTLSLGCDFHLSFENVQDLLERRRKYTIGETDYLLVELSDYSIPPTLTHTLQTLMGLGLRPVITHPERNPIVQHSPAQVIEWADAGAIVQLTASSLTGFWGRMPKKISQWLLERDAVHVIASDAHDTRHRPPLLSQARDLLARKDPELADLLVEHNPQAIVDGKDLPYFPSPLRKD